MTDRPKILIVDDRIDNLIVLEKVLKDTDADFIRALSGNDALALTLDHDFALALVDVQMPEMDGYEMVDLMLGLDVHGGETMTFKITGDLYEEFGEITFSGKDFARIISKY